MEDCSAAAVDTSARSRALVQRARTGDAAAFNKLAELYKQQLSHFYPCLAILLFLVLLLLLEPWQSAFGNRLLAIRLLAMPRSP